MTGRRQQLAAFTTQLPVNSRLRALQTTRIAHSEDDCGCSTKMDIASIPKVDSVVLMGLDFSMRPDSVRYELSKGFIKPAPEQFVMHKIKSLALMVYEQGKFAPL